jgi:hypothetical protein
VAFTFFRGERGRRPYTVLYLLQRLLKTLLRWCEIEYVDEMVAENGVAGEVCGTNGGGKEVNGRRGEPEIRKVELTGLYLFKDSYQVITQSALMT